MSSGIVLPDFEDEDDGLSLPDGFLQSPAEVQGSVPLGESDLWQEYERRVDQGRDLKVITIARNGATGVGKSTLNYHLGKRMDRTDDGFSFRNVTFDPDRFNRLYKELPMNSAILMEEAEQAFDSRRSMSNDNVEASHRWATMRYREQYTLMSLPSRDMLDKRLLQLADFLIVCDDKEIGLARVYRLVTDDFTGELRYHKTDILRWPPADDDPLFQRIEDRKAEYLESDSDEEDEEAEREALKDEVRRDLQKEQARELRQAGESIRSIREKVGNNPDTGNRYSTSTISDWVSDIET